MVHHQRSFISKSELPVVYYSLIFSLLYLLLYCDCAECCRKNELNDLYRKYHLCSIVLHGSLFQSTNECFKLSWALWNKTYNNSCIFRKCVKWFRASNLPNLANFLIQNLHFMFCCNIYKYNRGWHEQKIKFPIITFCSKNVASVQAWRLQNQIGIIQMEFDNL